MRSKILWLGLHLLNIVGIAGFYIYNLNRDYPWVGQDFSHFIPRLIDTYLHLKLNGPGIQWYTPSFGGGLPAFANPHHLQYSLIPWLMFALDPWQAFLTAVAIYTALGYAEAYLLQRDVLHFERPAATLGSIFWALTGFYLSHLLIGHVTFLTFPLFPLFLYLILTRQLPTLPAVIVFALLAASVVHAGGFYIAVIFAFSGAMTLPLIALMRPQAVDLPRAVRVLAGGLFVALLLTANKIYAAQSFMRFFPREMPVVYDANPLQKVTGIFFQLIGTTLIIPQRLLFGRDPNAIGDYLAARTGISSSLWELDTAVSGAAVLIVLAGLIGHAWRWRKSPPTVTKHTLTALALFVLAALALIQYIIAEGPIFSLLKSLPVIRSMHVNIRNSAAFIFPIALGAAFYLDRFFRQARLKWLVFATLNVVALGSLLPYLTISPDLHLRFVEIKPLREVYWQIRAGETFPVQKIGEDLDIEAIDRNASSLFIYEPVFGYEREAFHPLVVPGSIYRQDGDYLNMTNPASLVFPEENGLTLFERFKVTERDKLTQFANRHQPDFAMPLTQHLLNILAMATLAGALIALAGFALSGSFTSHKTKGRSEK
ncbi:MAG: hypothetical protein WHV44_06070 [Anaerolineales bacterium]